VIYGSLVSSILLRQHEHEHERSSTSNISNPAPTHALTTPPHFASVTNSVMFLSAVMARS
jgi:hypothetical protein